MRRINLYLSAFDFLLSCSKDDAIPAYQLFVDVTPVNGGSVTPNSGTFMKGESVQLLAPSGVLILNTYSPKVDIAFIQKITRELNIPNQQVTNSELWFKTTSGKELYYGIVTRIINY